MATTHRMADLHERATQLYAQGQLKEAGQLLSEAIAENQTSELWNDWAAVQARLGQFLDAERGFRFALRLNPADAQAAENLGTLLFSRRRMAEAEIYLKQGLAAAEGEHRGELQAVIEKCAESELSPMAESAAGVESAQAVVCTSVAIKGSAPEGTAKYPSASEVRKIAEGGSYEDWFASIFEQRVPTPGVRLATSWPEETEWGKKAHIALVQVECNYVQVLLNEIRDKQIPGDIAEFGIFEGWWIDFLWNATENIGLYRRVYGFDSFEGLSDPDPKHDLDFWKKGQYTCSLEQVEKNVSASARPRIKLVKGFFEKSLHGADALLAEQFSYVRIDCDIYQPALDCLRYLGPRLADGAILVFDDWPHMRGFGEQRAFEEWLPEVPHLKFEFLFYGAIGHFYIRVHHKDRWAK
jgi:tetratricopeptide (TPR) repeat protein